MKIGAAFREAKGSYQCRFVAGRHFNCIRLIKTVRREKDFIE